MILRSAGHSLRIGSHRHDRLSRFPRGHHHARRRSPHPAPPPDRYPAQRDTLSVHLANERAKCVIEALEVLKVLKPSDIETLYLAVEDAAQIRTKALML